VSSIGGKAISTMHRRPLSLAFAVVSTFAGFGFSAEAQAGECAVEPKLVTYFQPDTLPAKKNDSRCDVDPKGNCKKLALKGWLYLPPAAAGPGPHPLLVYNHGSEEKPKSKCAIGAYFAQLGYVVMMPNRRGHGEGNNASTGQYLTEHCAGADGQCKIDYLGQQVADIEKAIAFALAYEKKGKKVADPERMAIMGHSYGGIATMLANEKDLGQQAVIDTSGASQSWNANPFAREAMKEAARKAVKPMYLLEPLNDRSIWPTIELAAIAGKHCRMVQSALFGTIDANEDGNTDKKDYAGDWDGDGKDIDPRDKAHGKFASATDTWGPSVHEFMTRNFERPVQQFTHHCQGTSLADL
jgi:dienelactone hydrolase